MRKYQFLTILIVTIGLMSCSKNNEVSNVEAAGSSIDSLPNNTDPVVANSSASFASKVLSSLAATTGLPLKQWSDSSNWQSTHSRAMCEVGQVVKDSLSEAMNPDKIKCYVGAVAKNSSLSLPTDGSDVYVRLTSFPENPNMEPRIRMRINKDASGLINRFEMWSCFAYDGTNYQQSEYILQTIGSDRAVSSYSKHSGAEGSEAYGAVSSVSGVLNSDFQWTSKSMEVENYYNGSSGSFSQELSINQRASSFSVNGYNNGSWGQDIFSNAFSAVIQGINMDSPKNMALGDGSAIFNFDWCFDSDSDADCSDESGGNRHTDSDIQSWNGDTRANMTAADGDYYDEVSSAAIPSVSTGSAISFSGDEAWDCSSDSFQAADLSDMEDATTALGAAFSRCDGKYDYRDETDGGYACGQAQ